MIDSFCVEIYSLRSIKDSCYRLSSHSTSCCCSIKDLESRYEKKETKKKTLSYEHLFILEDAKESTSTTTITTTTHITPQHLPSALAPPPPNVLVYSTPSPPQDFVTLPPSAASFPLASPPLASSPLMFNEPVCRTPLYVPPVNSPIDEPIEAGTPHQVFRIVLPPAPTRPPRASLSPQHIYSIKQRVCVLIFFFFFSLISFTEEEILCFLMRM